MQRRAPQPPQDAKTTNETCCKLLRTLRKQRVGCLGKFVSISTIIGLANATGTAQPRPCLPVTVAMPSKKKSNGAKRGARGGHAKKMGELEKVLASHDCLSLVERSVTGSDDCVTMKTKVHCSLTDHDIPATVEAVQAHIKGRRFQRASWMAHDWSQYQPWLIANRLDDRLLFCTLTRKPVNKIPKDVTAHMNGKRFKRLKAEAEAKAAEKAEAARNKEARRLARLAAMVRRGGVRVLATTLPLQAFNITHGTCNDDVHWLRVWVHRTRWRTPSWRLTWTPAPPLPSLTVMKTRSMTRL